MSRVHYAQAASEMTKSNSAVAQHYQADPNDKILACDWCNNVGLVVLVRKEDASLTVISNQRTLSIPDAWCEHVSELVAFSSERLIVWPIERPHDERCKIGYFEQGLWSTAILASPLSLAANEKYLAVSYGEERVADGIDGSLFSDMTSIYEAGTLRRLSGVGHGMRKGNYQGVLMEVEACCFDEQDQFYFVAFDTPYIWSYDVMSDSVKFDPMPVASSYVCAITVEEKRVHLVVKDQSSFRVYSKLHGQTEWTDRRLSESTVFGEAEMAQATLLGKPGGKLLAYTEKIAVVLDIRHFQA